MVSIYFNPFAVKITVSLQAENKIIKISLRVPCTQFELKN